MSTTGRYSVDPKPGASSGSPKRVQGPKALGRPPPLLSQPTGRELDGKRGCRDRTSAHMGSWVFEARTLTTAPPCRAPCYLFKSFFLNKDLFILTERKIFHPMIHSPSDHNGQCCANSNPGARNFFRVSHSDYSQTGSHDMYCVH